jgi:hypothetical protein
VKTRALLLAVSLLFRRKKDNGMGPAPIARHGHLQACRTAGAHPSVIRQYLHAVDAGTPVCSRPPNDSW